jgi:DNA (cytosine-5)-methyltransferase 1
MLRAIREVSPRWVVGENVRGLTNWNGGLVFDEVQADLEAEGYEVLPFLLPACSKNAPHQRDRIWFIAHSKSFSRNNGTRNEGHETQTLSSERSNEFKSFTNSNDRRGQEHELSAGRNGAESSNRIFTNAGNPRLQGGKRGESYSEWNWPKTLMPTSERAEIQAWDNWPTQSPVCGRDDGLSRELDGITFPKWRNESIKAYGNAIVPQVAYEIFKAINEYEPAI